MHSIFVLATPIFFLQAESSLQELPLSLAILPLASPSGNPLASPSFQSSSPLRRPPRGSPGEDLEQAPPSQ